MKKSLLMCFSLAVLVVLSTSSCKKCKTDDTDVNTGEIINDASIYPVSGGLSANMGGNFRIDASHIHKNKYLISFDGGLTKDSVDYSKYNILCLPMSIKCEVSFIRDVTIDHANNKITYKINAKTCSSCEQTYIVENYVLVPVLPAYQMIYEPVITED